MQVPPFSLDRQLSEIGQDIDLAVLNVIHSGQYIGGSEVKLFEKSLADSIGVNYAIGCNSGTDALVLALRALDIGCGDEVLTPSFSFFATAEAISTVGAKPVFVDVDPTNFLIDLKSLEGLVNPSTKAVLPVHLFGRPVDMDALISFAKKNGLKVIEDCAQAAGASWDGKSVGSMGDIGCFSFFPTKNLGAAGDGGAVTTNDPKLAQRMKELAVHGMPRRYFHTELGYNSRLDAIQAAILNVKLPLLSKWIDQRRKIATRYTQLLDGLSCIELPLVSNQKNYIHSWNQFVIKVKNYEINKKTLQDQIILNSNQLCNESIDSSGRDSLRKNLLEKGVNTIIYYPIPIHLQPAYENFGYQVGSLPVTEKLCSQVLSLPMFPELNIEEQTYVADSIKQLISNI